MLKLPTASYYGLDEAGTLLWNALTRPCGTQELVALIRSEFQITEDKAVCDVNSFVHDLLAEGLIEFTAGAATSGVTPGVFESVINISARNARTYSPPVLERGLLRNAAHNGMGAHPDGGHTPGGTTQYS
jgi:Coenzyme PQQ synthesis protein D (PqqD)